MPNDDEMVNWATRLPQSESERVEKYQERKGLNKSEAVRRLVNEGLDDSEPDFFANIIDYMTGVALAATAVLVVSAVLIGTTGFVGLNTALSPWQVLAAASVTVLVAAGGISFRLLGITAWLDAQFGAVETAIRRRV